MPALSVSLNDQEGYVFPHGTVVSAVNLKTGAGAYNSSAGIDSTGYQAMGVGFSGTLKNSVQGVYGYDRTLDGIIEPCNGTNAAINDFITQNDVDIKRLKSNGAVASAADVESTVALTRSANQDPIGVIVHQVMRETRGSNMSYQLSSQAYSVSKYGVLNIPYVIASASRINTTDKQPGGDVGYRSVYKRHQFLTVFDSSLMAPEATVRVDGNGKLVLTSNTTQFPKKFGKIISWTNDLFPELNAFVDGFPDLNVPGTNTGGLTRRLFDFIKLIRQAQGQSVLPADIIADVDAGYYGMVKVLFNLTGINA